MDAASAGFVGVSHLVVRTRLSVGGEIAGIAKSLLLVSVS